MGYNFKPAVKNLMLSSNAIDLLGISNSNGKGVMIKVIEFKMIVAVRMATPPSTVKETLPQ